MKGTRSVKRVREWVVNGVGKGGKKNAGMEESGRERGLNEMEGGHGQATRERQMVVESGGNE